MRKQGKQRRARETVEKILAVAREDLEAHRPLRTNSIAKRAGVSIGSLYQYFDDTRDIIRAIEGPSCIAESPFAFCDTDAVAAAPVDNVIAMRRVLDRAQAVTLRVSASLLRGYGMTTDDYDRLLAAQGWHCALCSATHSRRSGKPAALSVDHEHASGRVRGLLCGRCNLVLGHIGDTPDVIATCAIASPMLLAYARGPGSSSVADLIEWFATGGPSRATVSADMDKTGGS